MTRRFITTLGLAFLAGTIAALTAIPSAGAAKLRYTWKPGTSYRFQAVSHDTLAMSGMGIQMKHQFTTDSTFGLRIERLRGDGVAEGTLTIEAFAVKDQAGHLMAGLAGLPAGALQNKVEVDALGNFKFTETVYLVVDEQGGNMLVSGSASATGATASAQAGDEKVTVYASFDPKTGQLSGGYTTEKIVQKKQRKTVAVKQDKPKVDLLPTQFMELLRLPEESLAAGQHATIALGPTTIDLAVQSLTTSLATIKSTVRTTVSPATAGAVPGGEQAEAEDEAPAMPGMGGFPGMGALPGMGAMPGTGGNPAAGGTGAAAAMPEMKLDGDFTMSFDLTQAMLSGVEGTLSTATKMGGMIAIDTTSRLKLKRL